MLKADWWPPKECSPQLSLKIAFPAHSWMNDSHFTTCGKKGLKAKKPLKFLLWHLDVMAMSKRTQKSELKRKTDLTNCSFQESHAVDYSLGTAEDLKTKQNIPMTLSSFNFIDHWDLKDLQRSAIHLIHGSYPHFYQTSSRDRVLATSPGGPSYFQLFWLYQSSLYELNSVSWELPECPIFISSGAK